MTEQINRKEGRDKITEWTNTKRRNEENWNPKHWSKSWKHHFEYFFMYIWLFTSVLNVSRVIFHFYRVFLLHRVHAHSSRILTKVTSQVVFDKLFFTFNNTVDLPLDWHTATFSLLFSLWRHCIDGESVDILTIKVSVETVSVEPDLINFYNLRRTFSEMLSPLSYRVNIVCDEGRTAFPKTLLLHFRIFYRNEIYNWWGRVYGSSTWRYPT